MHCTYFVFLGYIAFLLTGCAAVNLLKPRLPAPVETADGVIFRYYSTSTRHVTLAGDFNRWGGTSDGPYDPRIDPMHDDGTHGDAAAGDGIWTIVKKLAPGRYRYKYVIDSSTWVTDPSNIYTVEEGGYVNSLIVVTGSGSGSEKRKEKEKLQAVFTYEPLISGVEEVYVSGSFNDWNPEGLRMKDPDGDGVYEARIMLPTGRYTYKFVVDGRWEVDENAREYEDDGYGGQNAVLNLFPGMDDRTPRKVTFRYRGDSRTKKVYLAGTFNNWSPDALEMKDPEGDQVFEAELLLTPGKYLYKFIVDSQWLPDENAADFEEDNFGGRNSVLIVDDRFETLDTARWDSMIAREGVMFAPASPYLNRKSEDMMEITISTYAEDVGAIQLESANGNVIKPVSLDLAGRNGSYDIWSGDVPLAGKQLAFRFLFDEGDSLWYYGPGGFSMPVAAKTTAEQVVEAAGGTSEATGGKTGKDPGAYGSSWFEIALEEIPVFYTPDWVRDGIFYQIFPDRFYNGNPGNDPDFSEWYYEGANSLPPSGKTDGEYYHLIDDWYDVSYLTRSPYRTDGKPDYFCFYGGDIDGVIEKLNYLEDLGITIIYFNPVTVGRSNHKYDAGDYTTVDPHFGGNDTFRTFVDLAHRKGMKIIVEAVYNHSGDIHRAFQDSKTKGPESEYFHWYEWKKWPLPSSGRYNPSDYYECWWGFGQHPNLNFDLSRSNDRENSIREISRADVNWPVVNHFLEVGKFWLIDMDIDGFRMDVPNEVPFWFWEIFRREMRALKPDCYLLAELWSSVPEWIGPAYFDATMNYKHFKEPVLSFIIQGKGNARRFDSALASGRTIYPMQALQVMMNLLDSHDTKRILTVAEGDVDRLLLAVMFQFTYIGTPHIWYGDEIGMTGDGDPDCRRPFDWRYRNDESAVRIREFYTQAIQMRKDHAALRRGTFRTVQADGKVYCFARESAGESIVVILNAGRKKEEISLAADQLHADEGSVFSVLLTTPHTTASGSPSIQDNTLEVPLPPLGGIVLQLNDTSP
jgi:glycosidase